MDIDKIKKLIRLANNNPNEHEANLAARMACKLIETENPDFVHKNGSFEKTGTWNDIKRTTEPGFRSTSPTGRYPPGDSDFWNDIVNRMRREREEAAKANRAAEEEARKRAAPNWRADTKAESEYGYHYYDEADDIFSDMFRGFTGKRQPRKPGTNYGERLRKCSQCGKEVMTKRVTSTFRCNDCEAQDFVNHPKQEKKKVHQVINCKTCGTAINRYVAETDSWQCLCGASKITAREAASRGIKFT